MLSFQEWLLENTPQSYYAVYGFILPDGKVAGPIFKGCDHNDIAEKLGYNDEYDAVRHGLVRFFRQGTSIYLHLNDDKTAKHAASEWLKWVPDNQVHVDLMHNRQTKSVSFPDTRTAALKLSVQ